MAERNIFEYATRNKMRFSYNGMISVEDLWDMPLDALDELYQNRYKAKYAEESLLKAKSKDDDAIDIQIDIIKHIVSVKLEEKKKREKEAENRAKRQNIIATIAARDDKALEELRKMLDELE